MITAETNLSLERLLTVREVAQWLQVSEAWVRDHASRRRPVLPSVKLGKSLRFRREDVEDFIQTCLRTPTACYNP
jgi:excisionase family DNA binding protein